LTEPPIRASGISLGASGVGLVQLRNSEDLMARQSCCSPSRARSGLLSLRLRL